MEGVIILICLVKQVVQLSFPSSGILVLSSHSTRQMVWQAGCSILSQYPPSSQLLGDFLIHRASFITILLLSLSITFPVNNGKEELSHHIIKFPKKTTDGY